MNNGLRVLKILIVDDYLNNRKLLRAILEEQHIIADAPDGKEAIAMLKSERYDLVVTDFQMPGADGLEVTNFVKTYFPETKVILLTAYDGKVEPRGADAAPDKIIKKPYSITAIKRAICELFDDGLDDGPKNNSPFCGMEWDK